jgi:16S rRNA (uracil1498-N3)-methyltransferase
VTTPPLFWFDGIGTVQTGDTLAVTGAEAHHIVQVRRLRVGDLLTLADGAGAFAIGQITAAHGDWAQVTVEVISPGLVTPSVPQLVLVQALAKDRRDEAAVAAATGLGVDAVIPWQANQSVVRWFPDKTTKGRERWQRLVRAESKVARRPRLPEVEAPLRTEALAARLAEATGRAGALSLVLHEEASRGLETALRPALASHVPAIYLLVGPEGGIGEPELETLMEAGCQPVRLGREVLRSGFAGPAALAVLNFQLGRWAK